MRKTGYDERFSAAVDEEDEAAVGAVAVNLDNAIFPVFVEEDVVENFLAVFFGEAFGALDDSGILAEGGGDGFDGYGNDNRQEAAGDVLYEEGVVVELLGVEGEQKAFSVGSGRSLELMSTGKMTHNDLPFWIWDFGRASWKGACAL